MSDTAATISLVDRVRAGAIHTFTGLGAFAGLMALVHVFQNEPALALIWLGISMVIDTIDGPLARRYRINECLPKVDGAILDHVIDYMTYALIPALFVYNMGFLPSGWNLFGAGVIVVTALYCFANKEMKTHDNFFSGFPAAWNVVVLCFYIAHSPEWLNLLVVGVCVVLTFTPVKFIHPFRVKAFRSLTMPLTLVWTALALFLVLARADDPQLQVVGVPAFWLFVALSGYFLGLCFLRTVRGSLPQV